MSPRCGRDSQELRAYVESFAGLDVADDTPTGRYGIPRGTQCPHHERIFADVVRTETVIAEERKERQEAVERVWRAHNALAQRVAQMRPWVSIISAAASGALVALLSRLVEGA